MGKSFLIDFTENSKLKNFNVVKKILLINQKITVIEITDYIYPLKKLSGKKYDISNHINLSGFNPLVGPNFISLTDVYKSKKGIAIVGLKDGIKPNPHEKKILLKINVKAYCYHLIPAAIFAASLGLKIKAVGIVKQKN